MFFKMQLSQVPPYIQAETQKLAFSEGTEEDFDVVDAEEHWSR